MDKMKLYKACKHEVIEYYADHGYTLGELWRVVAGTNIDTFWLNTVLEDYEMDVLNPPDWARKYDLKRILNSIHKHIKGERFNYWYSEVLRKYKAGLI